MDKLVSIITAVYNGEDFIDNYINSVIGQTYSNIELIIVNDGSTDQTEKKIMQYEKKIKEAGIIFKYVKKENGGQSSAVNEGLKIFSGEYLTWPDIDDQMHYDYIQRKVEYMEKNTDVDYLISKSAIVDIKEPSIVLKYTWSEPPLSNEDVLNRMINDLNYDYEAGNFFVTRNIFEKSHLGFHIYDLCGKWTGAQIQMMLPIICIGNFGYLDECLFDYYLHENNDHNKYKSKEELKTKYFESEKMMNATVNQTNIDENKKIEIRESMKYRLIKKRMQAAFFFNDVSWYQENYRCLPNNKRTVKEKLKYLIITNGILNKLYRVLKDNNVSFN